MRYIINNFAQVYGACDYGGSTSQTGSCATSTSTSYGGTTSTSGGGATLTNTGFDILLIVSIACVITFLAMVVRIWRRPKKQATTPPPQFPTNRA